MEEGITIVREFDALRELVWKVWTEPEMIKKWWGPKDFTSPSATVDLRVGGKYVYAMRGPEGSQWDKVMYSAGDYSEIIPKEKIVATDYFCDEHGNKINPSEDGQSQDFPNEMKVVVTFEAVAEGKTKLTVTYPRPENEAHFQAMLKGGMKEGWGTSLDKMAAVLKQEVGK